MCSVSTPKGCEVYWRLAKLTLLHFSRWNQTQRRDTRAPWTHHPPHLMDKQWGKPLSFTRLCWRQRSNQNAPSGPSELHPQTHPHRAVRIKTLQPSSARACGHIWAALTDHKQRGTVLRQCERRGPATRTPRGQRSKCRPRFISYRRGRWEVDAPLTSASEWGVDSMLIQKGKPEPFSVWLNLAFTLRPLSLPHTLDQATAEWLTQNYYFFLFVSYYEGDFSWFCTRNSTKICSVE